MLGFTLVYTSIFISDRVQEGSKLKNSNSGWVSVEDIFEKKVPNILQFIFQYLVYMDSFF